MTYTVVWSKNAQDELLQTWIDSSSRGLVTRAADAIDPTLRIDPVLRGETYTASTRLLDIWPLAVIYRISEEDRIVTVISVHPIAQFPADD